MSFEAGGDGRLAGGPGVAADRVLEREQECQALSEVLSGACAGAGRLVVIRGSAGMGKTTLVQAAHGLAGGRGMRVLSARGAEFQRGFAFGVARQLFEPAVVSATARERAGLFAGSAALARSLFGGEETVSGDVEGRELVLAEGLSWFVVNLAAREGAGVLLSVDDAHWCDRATLRLLTRIALGVDQLRLVIALALRSGEPGGDDDLLAWLSGDPRGVVLEPAALSQRSICRLAQRFFGRPVDADFAAACREVTGGNPFLVTRLLDVLCSEGVQPSGDGAQRAREMVPEAVLRSVLARIAGLGQDARALGDAVAVLGAGTSIHDAARLADLAVPAADRAADALAGAGLFAPGHPLAFRHPLIARAVAHQLGGLTKARAHGRAARLLAGQGAPVERVAAHLVHSLPAADAWTVSMLRDAAAQSLRRGGPDGAVQLLRRALDEPPPAQLRGAIVFELARAEAAAGDPIAMDRLTSALPLVDDPLERVQALREISRLQFLGGHYADAAQTTQRALGELGEDHPLAGDLLVEYLASATLDDAPHPQAAARLATLIEQAQREAPPEDRGLGLQVAHALAVMRAPRERVREMVRRTVAAGPLDDLPPYGLAVAWAVPALACADELELAQTVAHDAHAVATRRGLVYSIGKATFFGALVAYELGLLERAIGEATRALQLAQSGGTTTLGWSAAVLCRAHLQRGQLDAARRAIGLVERTQNTSPTYATVLHARSYLALAADHHAQAWADALSTRDVLARYQLADHPLVAWRLPAALAGLALGHRHEASALADEEVDLARAAGAPRQLGAALTVRGQLATDDEQITLLEEATSVLDSSAAKLVHAQALYCLGAAHRRQGHRSAAREALLNALELALDRGADPLAARTRSELNLIGARPRRPARRGLPALTPSERRIVELAATGQTNRQIATQLHLTPSTIESHLTRAYHKLDVRSRHDLAPLLAQEHQPAPSTPPPALPHSPQSPSLSGEAG